VFWDGGAAIYGLATRSACAVDPIPMISRETPGGETDLDRSRETIEIE
jgi:hypothetical protein